MTDILLITFNGNNISEVIYNSTNLDTIIYNNEWIWHKIVDNDMYLVFLDTGPDSWSNGKLFDKTTPKTYQTGGVSGPLSLICIGSGTIKLQAQSGSSWSDIGNSFSILNYSSIDNFGYIFYSPYTSWQGGAGGQSSLYRIIFNEGLENERIYYVRKNVDENNSFFLEGDFVSKLYKFPSSSKNFSTTIYYYPYTYESEVTLLRLMYHNYVTGELTEVTSNNISTLTNGFVTSMSYSRIDAITFNLSYSISTNNSSSYRVGSFVFLDFETNLWLPRMLFSILQEPNIGTRCYFFTNTSASALNSLIFETGDVKEISSGTSVTYVGQTSRYCLYAIPNEVTVQSLNSYTPQYVRTTTWGNTTYTIYSVYNANLILTMQ